MELTIVGGILLPLTLASRRMLAAIAVFFIPFTATAIFNFSKGDTRTGLQVFTWFATIYCFRTFVSTLRTKKDLRGGNQKLKKNITWFLSILAISLIMPIYIHGSYSTVSTRLVDMGSTAPVVFSFANVTQYGYVVIGAFFAMYLAKDMEKNENLVFFLKAFFVSMVFCCIWGYYQLFSYYADIPYLELFNNSENTSAGGFNTTLDGIKRMSSVGTEPSIFADCLILAAAIISGFISVKRRIFKENVDRWILYLLIITTIISTSSTGLAGVVAFIGTHIVLKKGWRYFLKVGFPLLVVLCVCFFYYSTFFSGNGTGSKLTSYSALERGASILNGAIYFYNYPILGLGWGSATVYELIIALLANSGIIGLYAFFNICRTIVRSTNTARINPRLKGAPEAGLLAFISIICMFLTQGFPYYFGYFWFAIAICASQMRDVTKGSSL